jgi:hypothetical protein
MPSSMALSEWGSGRHLVARRVRQPSKSSRKTRATLSSNGWGSDCEYWAPISTRCETRSGCATAYVTASMLAQLKATSATGGRVASAITASMSP